jgi:hypothetical protein
MQLSTSLIKPSLLDINRSFSKTKGQTRELNLYLYLNGNCTLATMALITVFALLSLAVGTLCKFFHISYNKKVHDCRNTYSNLTNKYQMSKAVNSSNGCLPPPKLPNQRPFGFDRLEQLIRADKEHRLMQMISSLFRQTGTTMEHVFLGKSLYGTIEPANIEVLFTNDEGQYMHMIYIE